jgi:hypothetical protein
MKPPEPRPLSPLLLHAVPRCMKCGKAPGGRADDVALAMFGRCFRCCHPASKK